MFFLYELSNWSVNLAGMLILQQLLRHGSTRGAKHETGEEEAFLVSKDTQILLFIGQVARAYWGMSPPEIWLHDETMYTKVIVLIDFAFSLVLWTCIAILAFQRPFVKTAVPWKLRWPIMVLVAGVSAWPGSLFIHPDEDEAVQAMAFPFADQLTVFSLVLDVLAILPQLYVISNAEEE